MTELSIGWAWRGSLPPRRGPAWNHIHGGPEILLRWLESQLGLTAPSPSWTGRVTELAALLDAVDDAVWTRSLEVDRWATAADLLRRRDALRLAGWDGRDANGLPRLVCELARAESGPRHPRGGVAERLEAVLLALDRGQALPAHALHLAESPSNWPRLWLRVLDRLRLHVIAPPTPAAAAGAALREAQAALSEARSFQARADGSLRWLVAESRLAACEAVAGMLAAEVDALDDTVVLAEDPGVAVLLDGCLARQGLPTMGGTRPTTAAPQLQVLPLVLHFGWEPVDPHALLAFVSLPVGPIGRAPSRVLASALAEQPGLGSRAWQDAIEHLTDPERDPDGALRRRLARWLDHPRVPRGQPLPVDLVAGRCGLVARWAVARAEATADSLAPEDADGLRVLAAQASALGELASSHGGPVTEAQLARLLDAVRGVGLDAGDHVEADGGAHHVTSLAQVTRRVRRLVWLGLSTNDPPDAAWTVAELDALRACEIDLDDGSRSLRSRRAAERRGILHLTERLLAVGLPGDIERRPHPVWQEIAEGLVDHEGRAARGARLGRAIAGEEEHAIEPWGVQVSSMTVEPPPPPRPLWHVAPGVLTDRLRSSASSLEDRLACPLKWTLHYRARLRPSTAAELPNEFQLRGSFCHTVLEAVFGRRGPCPSVDDALCDVARVFDARIGFDAAPLAQPDRLVDRRRVRANLLGATRILVEALQRGNYELDGAEIAVEGEIDGRLLRGAIDCLARLPDGSQAVVDFKYGGRSKYPKLLAEGRALQLATYAAARRQQGGGGDVRVAYLLLADGTLHTPEGSALAGATARELVPDAPSVHEVWRRFVEALKASDGWIQGGEPVPARPLQSAEDWPLGVELALDAADDLPSVCRYCDYGVLCGRERLG